MKHIFYILFTVGLLFGNNELNSYLGNKNLQHQIIKDEKNQRIVIDLLDDESRIIIFTKAENKGYKKTFDEKLYFCNNYSYSNRMIKLENNKLFIVCSMPNVDNSLYREFYYFEQYSSLTDQLLSIHKQFINIDDDTIKANYIFTPEINIPTLYDFKNENFANEYLNKNYKNFVKVDNSQKQIYPTKQALYKTPTEITKMYLLKGDKVEILEEKDDWLYILYKGKKEIKAWIPKSAVE